MERKGCVHENGEEVLYNTIAQLNFEPGGVSN